MALRLISFFISTAILPIYVYPSVQADGPMAFSPCVASTLFALMYANGGWRCTVVYDDRLGVKRKRRECGKSQTKRAESPRLRIAQGKRSDALGKPLALRHALLRAKACLIDSVSTLLPLLGRAVLTHPPSRFYGYLVCFFFWLNLKVKLTMAYRRSRLV